MCNNHAHLKKWNILVVDQPKNVTMERRTEFEKKKKKKKKKSVIAWFEITPVRVTAEDDNRYAINPVYLSIAKLRYLSIFTMRF